MKDNLSSKKQHLESDSNYGDSITFMQYGESLMDSNYYEEEDVKEAIKKLINTIKELQGKYYRENQPIMIKIKEIFGEELTK